MDTLLVARNLNNLTGLWQKMGARPVASAGEGIYRRLGFSTQFAMHSFKKRTE